MEKFRPTDFPHHCHDPQILLYAYRLGIRSTEVINRACSIGEQPYDGFSAAKQFLRTCAEKYRAGNERTALSRNQKIEILQRNGVSTQRNKKHNLL